MRKFFTIALGTVLLATCLTGCQKDTEIKDNNSGEVDNTNFTQNSDTSVNWLIINSEPVTITPATSFDNYGITTYLCDSDDKYTFTSKNSEGITWNVYVLDNKFEDSLRYLNQAKIPALIGYGSIEIKEGQYIYVECSANSFTTDEIPVGPALEITRYNENAVDPNTLAGNYQDSVSQRASLTVTDSGDSFEIIVNWANSASENNEWKMTASLYDGNRLDYSNCTLSKLTYDNDGNETRTEVYTDGMGYFTVTDGKLYWDGAADPECTSCIFEKID